MNQKRYWLRGLVIGLIFGILVTYAHENVYEFANFLHMDFGDVLARESHPLYNYYTNFIQRLYSIAFLPWFFLGIFTMFVQYYLPPITYSILGVLIGWIYGKIKNRNKVI
jgi:hypothetical protein